MATTYLKRTTWGTPTNKKKFTFSFWFKNSKINKPDEECFLTSLTDPYASNNRLHMSIDGGEQLKIEQNDLDGYNFQMKTNRLFLDPTGWTHAVFKVDTTQTTEANRFKMFLNGVEETSWAIENYPELNLDIKVPETDRDVYIGTWSGSGQYWDGYMSYYYYTDGYAYDADTFGEFDSDSGEWKINTSPSVNYGTNGFLVLKDGNTYTDQSSNSNDFTLGGGTLTNTEDCPSDVFCTFNILDNYYQAGTYSNGNTTFQTNTTNYTYNAGTIGVSKGKFYWEVEYDAKSGGNVEAIIGITSTQPTTTTKALGTYPNDWGYHTQNVTSYYLNNDVYTAYGTAYTEGDIIGVALDADNNKLYFSKNGTWQNSGDPTSGSTGTGALSITAPSSTPLGAYFPSVTFYAGGNNGTFKANFGNGYFGTTAISSEGTNASSIGKFEYDVPTGYTALSTKGLNS